MSTAMPVVQPVGKRQVLILSMLKDMFARLFGREPSEIDIGVTLIEMGADSLALLQASQIMRGTFSIKVPFRLLLEELSTIEALAVYMDERLPAEFGQDLPAGASEPDLPQQQSGQPALVSVEPVAEPVPRRSHYEPPVDSTSQQGPPPAQDLQSRNVSVQQAMPQRTPKITPDAVARQMKGELTGGADITAVQRIITQQLEISSHQLQIMSLQLQLLMDAESGNKVQASTGSESLEYESPEVITPAGVDARSPLENAVHASTQPEPGPEPPSPNSRIEPAPFVAYEPIIKGADRNLSQHQLDHLNALIASVIKKTRTSKSLTQAHRPHLANSRATAGFRQLWKEIVYPLIIERAKGSRIWDVDGNEYIDLTMGFGALLFGHSPDFIVEALQEQIKRGIQLGAHTAAAGKAAQLICELTGVDRVAFCNSGTEAVMTALRIARTVTGRTRVAMFEGCYHGTFDEVLVRGSVSSDGRLRAAPMAPGVPQKMVDDVLLLKYNSPETIRLLEEHAHELAAVLIEPPRSRRPDVQPRAFLQELRRVTETAGAALIFDEIVTGFRFHPGGAQALFDIRADLVTYGKAVGGGLPVAIIAGKAEYMDAVDGGMWNYGDNSFPEADITYFAGTYFQHPLIMPSLVATLEYIKERGTRLQEQLDHRTARVVDTLNAYLDQNQVPIRVARIGSLFRLLHSQDLKFMDLFYYCLLTKGIFVAETHNSFLSTAHTDEDVEYIIGAFKESIDEMRRGGFLPGASVDLTAGELSSIPATVLPSSNNGDHSSEMITAPLTEAQKQIWALAKMGGDGSRAYNQSLALHLRGPLNLQSLRNAIQQIVGRHEALRTTFSPNGDFQRVAPVLQIETSLLDLSHLEKSDRESQLSARLQEEGRQEFDIEQGPLLSTQVFRLEPGYHVLALTAHHIISDGWSLGIILQEMRELYSAECSGAACQLPQPYRFSQYALAQAEKQQGPEVDSAVTYWLSQFAEPVPVLELPTDRARPSVQTYTGAQHRSKLDPALYQKVKQLSAQQGCTMFMTLLAAFKVLLHHLTNQKDIVVGTPSAGQLFADNDCLVGYCVNLLPLRSQTLGTRSFTEQLASLKRSVSGSYGYQDYPFGRLLKQLNLLRDPSRPPLVTVIFNVDRSGPGLKFFGLDVEVAPNHNSSSKFDITFDVTETESGLTLDCEYNTDLFGSQKARLWMNLYETILQVVVERPDSLIDDLRMTLRESERRHQETTARELKQTGLQKFNNIKRKAVQSL